MYTSDDETLMSNQVLAMVAVHVAIIQLSIDSSISISTDNSFVVLENSYPPSLSSFKPKLVPLLAPILHFVDN